MSNEVKNPRPRAVVAAVQLPNVSDAELESSLDELRELAKTLGFEVIATFTQKRSSFDATAYLGTGKREELKRFIQGEEEVEQAGDAEEDAPEASVATTRAEKNEERRIARHGLAEAREAAKAAKAAASGDQRRAAYVLVDHEISRTRRVRRSKLRACVIWRRACARQPNSPARRGGKGAVSAAAAPAKRRAKPSARKSATASPNSKTKSSPSISNGRRSARAASTAKASRAWR
ncbi:MAG: hypothetical protein EBT83_01210 [Betaproteobacteria bacterium]|nr:hypothetical protein [Betaproteobacteria bacterium]